MKVIRTLAIFALFILLTGAAGCVEEDLADVEHAYAWDDGPWITFCGEDPTTTVCVSWLTSTRRPTELWLGIAPETPGERHYTASPRTLHSVRIDDLTPDTAYTYRVDVDFTARQPGRTLSFRTAPADARPLRIAVVGDMQPDTPQELISNRHVAEAVRDLDADVVVQVGDAAQIGGDALDWHMLFESLPLIAANTPLLPAIGNHDTYGDGGANWEAIFPLPLEGAAGSRYYATDIQDTHLVFLDNFDSEGDAYMSAEQLAWLEADLAAANDQGQWIFVFMHLSILSSGTANMIFGLQEELVPIFDAAQVDGVFYGHDHMYEHYLYEYGTDGLVHDPAHTGEHVPIHYWETGGGGAELEAAYGLLDREPERVTRSWYNQDSTEWVDVEWEVRPWDPDQVLTTVDPRWAPQGGHAYHIADERPFQDDATHYGQDYGENTLSYMVIEVDGDTATVSAHYPDGALIEGPHGSRPQRWVLER